MKLCARAVGDVDGATISLILLEDNDETFLGRPRVFYRVKALHARVENGARKLTEFRVKYKSWEQAVERFNASVDALNLRGKVEWFV